MLRVSKQQQAEAIATCALLIYADYVIPFRLPRRHADKQGPERLIIAARRRQHRLGKARRKACQFNCGERAASVCDLIADFCW